MKINKKLLSVILMGAMAAGTISVSAAQFTKTAQLFYNNIKVKVDGEYKKTNVEPFMINGTVYVSLRDAAQLTDNGVDWNGLDQAVEISTGNSKPSNYEQELAAKNAEIMNLRSQLEKLKGQVEDEKEDSNTSGDREDDTDFKSLKETEEALKEEYKKSYNVEWSFDLEEEDDTLVLEVSYDGYYDKEDFGKMSSTSVENLMKAMCKFIQEQYGSALIEGKLYNNDNNETISEFSLSTKGAYKYTKVKEEKFTKENLKEFAKELKGEYNTFPEINFDGQYDSKSIRMKDIELTEKGDTIIYDIHTTFMNTFSYIWNALEEGSATSKLENYMDDIQEEIEDEFDVRNVEGYLYNVDGELMAEYRNGDLKLKKIN